MHKLKLEYYWFLIFAICFSSFQYLSSSVRPNYRGDNALISYFLGVAPNFFPAIGIPAIFVLFIFVSTNSSPKYQLLTRNRHLKANLFSLTGLIVWEFMQLDGKLVFDWHDVLWTFLGAMVFQGIWLISPSQFKVLKQEN